MESVALLGVEFGANTSQRLSAIGDFNGDQRPDFAIAAPTWRPVGTNTSQARGAVHVVFGSATWAATPNFNLANLNGTNGFTVYGEFAGDDLGQRVEGVGDVNGDGFADLAMFSRRSDIGGIVDRGCIYVLFGGPQVGASGVVQATSIGGTSGLRIYPPVSESGQCEIRGVGDVDGDGFDDLAISAPTSGPAEPSDSFGGDTTECVAAGDIDGDGDGDFVVGQLGLQRALVFTNTGGQFSATAIALGRSPESLALEDLDSDGDLDLVVDCFESSGQARIAVRRCIGGTVFGALQNIDFPERELLVRLGDVDGDGDTDIVAANHPQTTAVSGAEKLHVLLNNGLGNFTTANVVTLSLDPTAFAVGDLDGDGDADIAVSGHFESALQLYRSLGNGALAAPVASTPGSSRLDVFIADVDGDGLGDVFSVSGSDVYLARNQGFSLLPAQIIGRSWAHRRGLTADIDGDGDQDVVTCGFDPQNTFACLVNNGSGSFPAARHFPQGSSKATDIALTDLDSDGDLDAVFTVVASLPTTYSVIRAQNFGGGTFGGLYRGYVAVLRGGPSLATAGAIDLGGGATPYGFVLTGRHGGERLGISLGALGDIDGDGLEDFSVTALGAHFANAAPPAHFVIRGALGLGASGFVEERALSGPDGFALIRSNAAAAISWFGAWQLTAGDFDGDGTVDLITGGDGMSVPGGVAGEALVLFGSNTLGISGVEALGQADGVRLLSLQSQQGEDEWALQAPAVGDFNADGRDDIVFGAPYFDEGTSNRGAAVGVWGAPRPFPSPVIQWGSAPASVAFRMLGATANSRIGSCVSPAGDVDGDGIEDLLISDWRFNSGVGRALLVLGQQFGAPVPYCTSQTNSQGCAPSITWTGALPSVSDPDPFRIQVSSLVNAKPGLLLYGRNGQTATPLGGGWLCVLPPIRRTPPQLSGGSTVGSDCSGSVDFNWTQWMALGSDPGLTAGLKVNAQYWSRDPQSPSLVNLTDALEFFIGP